ncbi:hypothetical protein BH11BAC2_BH11BAC2_24040 [soil metagenome]
MIKNLPEGYTLLSPQGKEAFVRYLELRWKVLREPWQQPRGTEFDDQEDSSFHLMIQRANGEVVACGRIQQIDASTAQVRYMAVDEAARGLGLGAIVLTALEAKAQEWGLNKVFLQARENAVPFYVRCGYQTTATTFLLYETIQHYKMEKVLSA